MGQIAELRRDGMQAAYPDTAPFIKASAPVYDKLREMVGAADYAHYMQLLEQSRR